MGSAESGALYKLEKPLKDTILEIINNMKDGNVSLVKQDNTLIQINIIEKINLYKDI